MADIDKPKNKPRGLTELLSNLRKDIMTPEGRERISTDLEGVSADVRNTVVKEARRLRDLAVKNNSEANKRAVEEFQSAVADLEKRMQTLQQKGVMPALIEVGGDALQYTGEKLGDATTAAGVQLTRAGMNIYEMASREKQAHYDNPNESGGSKILRYTGLGALIVVGAAGVYKLAQKVSNAGLKEGEKPGLLRKILKWTGALALSTAAVNFLGPRVLAAQQSGGQQSPDASKPKEQTPETKPKTAEPPKSDSAQPEVKPKTDSPSTPSTSSVRPSENSKGDTKSEVPPKEETLGSKAPSPEKILSQETFLDTELKIVEIGKTKFIEINGNRFRVARAGKKENLAQSMVNIKAQKSPSQLIFNDGIAAIDGGEFSEVLKKLSANETRKIPVRVRFLTKMLDEVLEFTPEKSS